MYTSGDIRYEREGSGVKYVELEYLVVYSYGTVHILRKSFLGWIFVKWRAWGIRPVRS